MNPELVYKTAKAALTIKTKLPDGHRPYDYAAMCAVHDNAVRVHKEYPDWRAGKIADHIVELPQVKKYIGKRFTQISRRTVEKWIRAAVKLPVGRPKGSRNTISR